MNKYFKIISVLIFILLIKPLEVNAQAKVNPLKTDVDTLAWLVDYSNAIAFQNHDAASWSLKASLDLQDKLSKHEDDSLYFNTFLNNIILFAFLGQYKDALEANYTFISEASGTKYEIKGYAQLIKSYIDLGYHEEADLALAKYLSLSQTPQDYYLYLYLKEERLYYDSSLTVNKDYINLCKEIISHPCQTVETTLVVLKHWASLCDTRDYVIINNKLEQIISNEKEPVFQLKALWERYINSLNDFDDTSNEKYLDQIIEVYELFIESEKINNRITIGSHIRWVYEIYINALFEKAAIYFENDFQHSYCYIKTIGELFDDNQKDSRIKNNTELRLKFLSDYYRIHLIYYLEDASQNATPTLDYMYDIDEFVNKYRSFCAEYIDDAERRIGHLSKEEKYNYLSNFYDLIDDIIFLENVFDNSVSEKHLNLELANRIPSFNLCACYRGLVMDADLQLSHRRLAARDTSKIHIPQYDDYIKGIKNKIAKSACLFYVKHHDGVDNHYGVFVINQDYTYPKYFGLGSEDEIFGEIENKLDVYTSDVLYKKIVHPISHLIDDTQDLYIVPDGILYSVNFAALLNSSQNPLYKQYNIKQLSDLRQLLKEKDSFDIENIVLYGGLKYHFNGNDLRGNESCNNIDYYRQIYIPDSLYTRGSISYLPHSKIEVKNIEDILKKKDINVSIRSGKKGTEESFKNLTNQSPSIIHIATHGFYYKRNGNEESEGDTYESGMLRSGLLMSGGADALCGVPSKRIDDGILLADEVAQLDLSETELVVLSACETGLGDTTTEGLIGLVRGFKLAGAQTLILSLWPVNDFVTNELMTDFYTYLCDGKSKREAFYKAVDNCRIKYQHPRLWAPFVMID